MEFNSGFKGLIFMISTPWGLGDCVQLTDTTSLLWTSFFLIKHFRNTTFRKYGRLPERLFQKKCQTMCKGQKKDVVFSTDY